MTAGLSIDNVVRVNVLLSPLAIPYANFGVPVIVGPSAVIDTNERLRLYSSADGVAADFGTSSPEWAAANLFFSQAPRPSFCFIGRWAKTATSGVLHGAPLTVTASTLANFQAITSGSLQVTVDGTVRTVAALNLSGALNLNGVASLITAALTGAVVTWNAALARFDVTSSTTGATSTVSFAAPTGSGTDISAMLGLTSVLASPVVPGIAAETPIVAAQRLIDLSTQWYALGFADASITDAQHVALAGLIEGTGRRRVYGYTTGAAAAIDATQTSDLASQLKALRLNRTFGIYSTTNPYAVFSAFGRALTVNWEGSRTALTLMFKQLPGVAAETLTETQAATLKSKNLNVFVNYNNGAAILQEGRMAGAYFFDEVHGTDWLQNRLQTDVFNLLYQSTTKVPQTDEGMTMIAAVMEAGFIQSVTNGLAAPGVWNADGFGQLRRGDTLPKGYYIYMPPVATQGQADREARKSVPFQAALKLAGAVHSADVLVTANR